MRAQIRLCFDSLNINTWFVTRKLIWQIFLLFIREGITKQCTHKMNDSLSRCTFLVVFYNVFFMFSSSVSVAVYMLFFFHSVSLFYICVFSLQAYVFEYKSDRILISLVGEQVSVKLILPYLSHCVLFTLIYCNTQKKDMLCLAK